MQRFPKKTIVLVFLISFLSLLVSPFIYAAGSDKEMKGWENDSEYNQLYNPKEMDKLKGRVEKFKKLSPLAGMSKATVLILDDEGDKIAVHICPLWFATPKDTGIKRGDKVKIKGSWAEIDGKDVFMASKIKKGDNFSFKVRLTKDGTPFWNMSPEQLAHERAQQ
ncbi:MAG: hypothetical protein ABFR63_11170 [Thermodesulfobacteriota bacterium]